MKKIELNGLDYTNMRLKAVELQRRSRGMQDIVAIYVQVIVDKMKESGVDIEFDIERNEITLNV